ncbi:MAG: hypothetical protein DRI86_16355 [Bacteroidetes bacterium]|nr:MAG: hypothetical protein DRI86_16355 [Bacteroidota bacterium]
MNKHKYNSYMFKYPILLLFTIISSISYSQSIVGVNFGYGIPYYNIVINNNANIDYTPKNLIDIELNYKKRWPGTLNFGSSISYQFQGSHFNVDEVKPGAYVYQSRDYYLHFINIKAFPEFVFGNNLKYYLQLGPSMSFLVYSDIDGYTEVSKDKNNPTKVITEDSGSASEVFDIFNFMLFMGAGIDVPIDDKITINANIQFQYNINSWFAVEHNTYSDRSLIFKIGLSYKLPQAGNL